MFRGARIRKKVRAEERKFKIDDAVGAVAIHGYCGSIGVIVAGFLLWGYPSSPNAGYAPITPWGQLVGAVIMFFVMGFVPCYVAAWALKKAGVLRIPWEVELAGMDHDIIFSEAVHSREFAQAEREDLTQDLRAANRIRPVGGEAYRIRRGPVGRPRGFAGQGVSVSAQLRRALKPRGQATQKP